MFEPTVAATVVTPAEFVGPLMLLCQERRGEMTEHMALGAGRALLKCAWIYCPETLSHFALLR